MAQSFRRQTATESEPMKVLFVNVNEEDTSFLTKDVPIKVEHAECNAGVESRLEQEHFDALVMNLASPSAGHVRQLKASHDTAVFLLADSVELSKAIEVVKQGADGFLLRGVSKPASLVELMKSANRGTESNPLV